MYKLFIFFIFLFFFSEKSYTQDNLNFTNYVDPFIGSDNSRWTYFAPVSAPYGLIRMGPVTNGLGGYKGGGWPVGYNFNSTTIQGISLIKSYQISGLLILPHCNANKIDSFESYIAHQSEIAKPGFYQVKTYDNSGAVITSATSTQRSGFLNFDYECESQFISINYGEALGENGLVGFSQKSTSGKMIFLNSKTVQTSTTFKSPYLEKPVTIFYHLIFDKEFEVIKKTDQYVLLKLNSKDLNLKAGASYVSFEGARKNLKNEIQHKSFQNVLADTQNAWDALLGRINVQSELKQDKVKFYTALWNVLSSKTIADDHDKKYLSYDGKIKFISGPDNSQEWHIFNTDSLWGSHWTINQVWSLFYPEMAINYANNLLVIYRDSGWLPDGWTVNQPTPGMPTNSSSIFLASLISKNFYLGDSKTLVDAIKKNNLKFLNRPKGFNKEGLRSFREYGFIPIDDKVYGSASETLEYSFDDFCANNSILKITGDHNNELNTSSKNFKNLFSEQTNAFVPKNKKNKFIDNFDINSTLYFAEGNGSQYLWYVPHELSFLLDKLGEENFHSRLESSIKHSKLKSYKLDGNTSGYANLEYNPGNETDMHMPWIFSFIRRYDLTHFYVKDTIHKFYGNSPYDGYGNGQDEDQGQLSAWLVLSSIGIFDITGNCALPNSYYLIPPIFRKITIHSKNFKLIINNLINTNRNTFDFYLNGEKKEPFISYEDLITHSSFIYK